MSRTFFSPDGKFIVESNGETVAVFGRDDIQIAGTLKVDEVKIGGKDGPLLQKEAGTGALVNGGAAVGGGSALSWGGVKSDDFQAESNKAYLLTVHNKVVTLPAAPADGDQVAFHSPGGEAGFFIRFSIPAPTGVAVMSSFGSPLLNSSGPLVQEGGTSVAVSTILQYDSSGNLWFPVSSTAPISND